jgi:uncharacterized damage-inducible protein DinB
VGSGFSRICSRKIRRSRDALRGIRLQPDAPSPDIPCGEDNVQILDMVLPEFDRETTVTRLLLERAPESRLSWAPHPRSRTLGDLCLHLADLPLWAVRVMQQSAYDLSPDDAEPQAHPPTGSQQATLARFDDHVRQARAAIAGASDADLLARWTLQRAGRTLFAMPRASVLRTLVLAHLIHHRGQLSVYLRVCDVPLPAIYGPSADSEGRDT